MSSNSNEVKPDIDSDSSSSDSGDEENSTPIDEEIRNIAIAEEEKMSNEDSPFTKPHDSDVQGVDDSISGDSILVGDTENHTKEPMLDTQTINNETSIGEESNILENGDSEGGASKEISDDNIRKDSDDAGNKDSDFNIIKESDDEIKKADENDLIKVSEDSSSSDSEDESKDPVDKPKEDFKDILQSLTEQNFEHKTPVDKVNKDSEDDIHHDSGSNLNKDSDVESNNKDDRDSDWIVIGSKEGEEKDLIKDTEDSSSSDSEDEVNNDPVDKSKEDFKDILQSLKKQNFEHKTPEKKELHQETYTNIIPASPEKDNKIEDDPGYNKSSVRSTAQNYQSLHKEVFRKKENNNNNYVSILLRKELEDQAAKERELQAAGKILTLSEDSLDDKVIRGGYSLSPEDQTSEEDDTVDASVVVDTATVKQMRLQLEMKTPSRLKLEMEEASAREKELKTQGKIITLSEDTVDEKVIRTSDLGKIPAPATLSFNINVASNRSDVRDQTIQGVQRSPKGTPVVLKGRSPKGMMQKFINSGGKLKTEGFTSPRP